MCQASASVILVTLWIIFDVGIFKIRWIKTCILIWALFSSLEFESFQINKWDFRLSTLNIIIFCDVKPCGLVTSYKLVKGTCCLLLQRDSSHACRLGLIFSGLLQRKWMEAGIWTSSGIKTCWRSLYPVMSARILRAVEMNLCLSVDSEDRNEVSANSYTKIRKKHIHMLLVLYPE